MNKHKQLIVLLLIFFLSFNTVNAFNRTNKRAGIGIIVGEPTGISFKIWANGNSAVDGAVAWSLNNDIFHLHLDYLLHSFNFFRPVKGELPLYYGIGIRGRLKNNGTNIGVRIPLGLEYLFSDVPVDIFLEIVPVLELMPATDFSLDGAVGARFYF